MYSSHRLFTPFLAVCGNLGAKWRFWAALAVSSLYGLTDEFHQSFVAGRDMSGFDVVADVVGAGVVCLIWYYRGKIRDQI